MSELEQRAKRRAQFAFMGLQKWRQQHGVPQLEHLLLAAFSATAECRGLWQFLIEKGIATEAEHQDYLDKGWQQFLGQMEAQASKIYVSEGGNG